MKIGIIGGAGYTAGELLRLLIWHPEAKISFVHSSSNAGKHLYEVHEGLFPQGEMRFCDDNGCDFEGIDVLFLCSAHGQSRIFLEEHKISDRVKIIDLAQDFRDESNGFVYGLPEMQKEKIRNAGKVANPGCFATAIQLSLLPLACKGLLKGEISVTAITGSTGAGVKPSATTHFSWRSANLSSYKVFEHQHLKEIRRNLSLRQEEACGKDEWKIDFVPMRGDFSRGIFANVHLKCSLSEEEATECFKSYYKDAVFTSVCDFPLDLKQVINTNKGLIHIEKHDNRLVIDTVIDNLLKGASGQAVQNMNIMFSLPEDCGLRLKASAF